MKKSGIFVLTSLFAAATAFAGYSAQVQQVPDFQQRVKTLALAPMDCPGTIDCLRLEQDLAKYFASYKMFKVIPSEQVRQTLFNLGAKAITDENRPEVQKQLGADALVFATIGSAGTEAGNAVGVFTGTTFVVGRKRIKHGSVELSFVAPDGKVLLQGQGTGISRNNFVGEGTVVLTAFKVIVEKAFPKAGRY